MRAKVVVFVVVPLIAIYLARQQNFSNICNSFKTYYSTFLNTEPTQHPDLDDDIVSIIQRYTGVSETHEVETEDGYILKFFRIPKQNPKGVIFLQHPIFFDARLWVSQYNESVAFFFWKEGYDVWLGNTRGNFFCKEHVTLEPSDPKFWNFSFHEMGYYDNHALANYIHGYTGAKIVYVGYSLGASNGLVYASNRSKEASETTKLMVVMAPATHINKGTSAAKYTVAPFLYLQNKFNFLDLRSTILRHDIWYLKVLRSAFSVFPCKKCILYLTGIFSGWTPDEMDPGLIDMSVQRFGSEIPLKILNHFYQTYVSGGHFHMYDYGEEENLELYGLKDPPLYPLKDVKIPVLIFYGQNDSFVCPEDHDVLYNLLPERATAFGKIMIEGFNHGDFVSGRSRNEKVYRKIVQVLEKF